MNGKGHARIARGVGLGLTVTGIVIAANGRPDLGFGLAWGGLGGFLVTPDADHNVETHEEKRWKGVPVVGPYVLETFAGYGAKYKHRGRSHVPIWGTVTRIWYFGRRFLADGLLLYCVWAIAADRAVTVDRGQVAEWVGRLPGLGFFLAFFVGWAVQDTVHIVTDWVWSAWQKWKKRDKGPFILAGRAAILLGIVGFIVYVFMIS